MTAEVIDGKAFTAGLCAKLAAAVVGLKAPRQALAPPVFAGGDPCHEPY